MRHETRFYDKQKVDYSNREVIQTAEYPQFLSLDMLREWRKVLDLPPRTPTPLRLLDLTELDLGTVYIKDESDRSINPTGTMKDRFALHLGRLYGERARDLLDKYDNGEVTEETINTTPVPRVSDITSGNEGQAIAHFFAEQHLPPPKLLIHKDIKREELEKLKRLRADIYMTDFSAGAFLDEDILQLTDNQNGFEATSFQARDLRTYCYDGLAEEVFAENPNFIYLPYGSGKQFEDLIKFQMNHYFAQREPRIKMMPIFPDNVGETVDAINEIEIYAAEPEEKDSIADKLVSDFRPYSNFHTQKDATLGFFTDLGNFTRAGVTGFETAIFTVEEVYIKRAYDIMRTKGFKAEASAAAGLALYIKRCEENAREIFLGGDETGYKVVIVNTGNGTPLPHAA